MLNKTYLLAGALSLGLLSSVSAQTLVVNDTQTIGAGNWTYWSINGGNLTSSGFANITTPTTSAVTSVYVVNGSVNLNAGATINNYNSGIVAFYVKNGSANITNTTINAVSAAGFYIDGGQAVLTNSIIGITQGSGGAANGILLRVPDNNSSFKVTLNNVTINSVGYGIEGIAGSAAVSSVTVNGGVINTNVDGGQNGINLVGRGADWTNLTVQQDALAWGRLSGISTNGVNLTVINSTAKGETGSGVFMSGPTGRGYISGSSIYGGGSGIYAGSHGLTVIENSTVTSADTGLNATNTNINTSLTTYSAPTGISFKGSGANQVPIFNADNITVLSSLNGVVLQQATSTISNSNIEATSGHGVNIFGGTTKIIDTDIVATNGVGVYSNKSSPPDLSVSIEGSTITATGQANYTGSGILVSTMNATTTATVNVSDTSILGDLAAVYLTGNKFNASISNSRLESLYDVGLNVYSQQNDTSIAIVDSEIIGKTTGIEFSNGKLTVSNSVVSAGTNALLITGQADASLDSVGLNQPIQFSQSSSLSNTTPYLSLRNSSVKDINAVNSINPTEITVEAVNSEIVGNLTSNSTTHNVFHTFLKDNSKFKGLALDTTTLSIDPTSEWYIPNTNQNSVLRGNLHNDGLIEFAAPSSHFSSITAGGLTGSGRIIMNTDLAALEGDHITINGNTTGSVQTVFVNNSGATPTSYTGNGPNDGLQLISVTGTSDGLFYLGNPVVLGIYDYTLLQADGQNWYLQTVAAPIVEPPVEPPVAPPIDPGKPSITPPVIIEEAKKPEPHIVDTISGYLTVPDVASRMVVNSFNNARSGIGVNDRDAGAHNWNVWAKGTGWTGEYGKKYELDSSGLVGQIGLDYLLQNIAVAGDRTRLGAWVGYGTSYSSLKHTTAKFELNGPQVGIYAIYNQEGSLAAWGKGLSIDAMAMYSWLEADLSAKAISGHTIQAKYDVNAWGVSIEGGYGFGIAQRTILRPLIGFTYSQVDTPTFTDTANMRVKSSHNGSQMYSAGLRLEYQLESDPGTTIWMYGGGEYETASTTKIIANDTYLANKDSNGLRGVIGTGIKGYIAKDTEIFGSTTLTTGKNLDYELRGSLGLRTRF